MSRSCARPATRWSARFWKSPEPRPTRPPEPNSQGVGHGYSPIRDHASPERWIGANAQAAWASSDDCYGAPEVAQAADDLDHLRAAGRRRGADHFAGLRLAARLERARDGARRPP